LQARVRYFLRGAGQRALQGSCMIIAGFHGRNGRDTTNEMGRKGVLIETAVEQQGTIECRKLQDFMAVGVREAQKQQADRTPEMCRRGRVA